MTVRARARARVRVSEGNRYVRMKVYVKVTATKSKSESKRCRKFPSTLRVSFNAFSFRGGLRPAPQGLKPKIYRQNRREIVKFSIELYVMSTSDEETPKGIQARRRPKSTI